MVATPEPEEEEKAPAAEAEVTPEVDMEVWMQRIRSGWTLASATGITVGELYLIVSLESGSPPASSGIKDPYDHIVL